MGCIFSRPHHSSPSPELASVHDKLQAVQDKTSGKQTTATTAESTVARVIHIGASSATKATASDSLATANEPSEQGKAAVSGQPQEVSEAEEQRQKRAPPVVSGDEVDFVFSTIKAFLGSPQDTVDVQTLKVPTRTEAEVKLAQWSELGKVVVDWTTPLVAMLPFGPPMAAVIGGIYNRAAQAAINSANCAQLLELVQQCDRQLAKLYRGAQEQQGGLRVPDDAAQGMRTMAELLVEAGHVMASYSRHGFLMRAIMSNIHKAEFEILDADIRAAMQVGGADAPDAGCLVPHLRWVPGCWLQETCFAMTVELVITQGTYTDERAAFRAAVCTAVGLPESEAEQAVKTLQQSEPELLRTLLKQHGGLEDQVIVSELEALSAELIGIKLDIADVKSQIAQLQESQDKAAARGPVALPKYLQTWWKDTVGRLIGRVANNAFLAHLVNWFKQKGLESTLAEFDETLREEGVLPLPHGQEHVYLHCVVMPLMDKDGDGYVLGIEYAKTVALGLPEGLPELLEALFLGFDRKQATKKLVSIEVLALMCSKLQASSIHASGSHISHLL
ncbi:uncharacterized protein HaLaN_08208 [Haematococcus lacustris]|uniref:Uncharacterized protein n=1 Tax=Haematococcus lacustris TaxID=44745 RepID=A0A699Z0H2_HAELA|nr:uncharacterized protein HaLaN_08208 [Haematococcus lacustris]